MFNKHYLLVICVVCFLFLSSTFGAKKQNKNKTARKCSRVLSRIPVHKSFVLDKFLGTWYDVKRTTNAWGDNTFKSSSIEFYKNTDGTYSYSLTGKLGDTCLPVQFGTVESSGRPGQYLLKDSSNTKDKPTMIISFTDYKRMALVFYCFKYKPGRMDQCRPKFTQSTIMSRSVKPKKKEVLDYSKRTVKRLCTPAKDLVSTVPGRCKIPDILKAAKKKDSVTDNKLKDLKSASSTDKCAVNNIPVQQDFSLSQMEGLWYEIARTRFTFNNLEAVVSYHRYDAVENYINSLYTGVKPEATAENPCNTPIQGMSKTKDDGVNVGDMVGRIGGPESKWPWSPMKVLYADDTHLMFYACYGGASDEPCMKNLTEVTLVGRSGDIDASTRDQLYAILPNICLDQQDMIETLFVGMYTDITMTANCSSWVSVETNTDEVEPSDCLLKDIPTHEIYTNKEIGGTWYLHASITANGTTAQSGVAIQNMVDKKTETVQPEAMQTRMATFSPDEQCTEYDVTSRDGCRGNRIKTLPWLNPGTFVFSKILFLSDNLLVEYVCTQRTIDGTCATDGVMFHVYTKNTSMVEGALDDEDTSLISNLAKSACLDPSKLKYETRWCSFTDIDDESDVDTDSDNDDHVDGGDNDDDDADRDADDDFYDCDVDGIHIFSDVEDFKQEQIYGYWFELARSNGTKFLSGVDSLVAYFTSDSNETLQIYYTGYVGDKSNRTCNGIERGSMVERCVDYPNGDYLARYTEHPDHVTYVPFKVIYTDYTNVLVTYICLEVQKDGLCSEAGKHVRVWGRNTSMEADPMSDAYYFISFACVEPYENNYMVNTIHSENESCYRNLNEFVIENDLTNGGDDVDHEDDYLTEDDVEQQKDGIINDVDDIEAALLLDDDLFYNYD